MDGEPWSPELLDYLSADFVKNGYDIKRLIATIVASKTYQMRAVARPDGPPAHYSFRGPELRRLTAEQFADAIATVTGDWHIARPRPAPPAPAAAAAAATEAAQHGYGPCERQGCGRRSVFQWHEVARRLLRRAGRYRREPHHQSRYSRLPRPKPQPAAPPQPRPRRPTASQRQLRSPSASGRARQLCARMADRRQQPHSRSRPPDSRSSLYQPRRAGHQHASRGTGEWRNLESLAVARGPENVGRFAGGTREPLQPPGERRSLPPSRAAARQI